MKKLICIALTLLMLLPLVACTAEPEEKGLRTALDLTSEWDKVTTEGSLVQGCIIVRKDFADAHPAEIARFLEEYKNSIALVNDNPTEAAELIAAAGIIPKAALAKKAIPNCNIEYIDGADMKASLSAFYSTMYSVNPASIGGAIPDDGIYYTAKENAGTPDTELEIKFTVLSGTTGMGMAQMIAGDKNSDSLNCKFTVVSEATAIPAAIIGGTTDIAAVPTNLASTLYKKTNGNVYVLALNTRGVLYLLEDGNTVNSVADLKGKTVYVPGAGTNPEYILKYIIEQNGLTVGEDVIFDYTYGSPDALAEAVKSGLVKLALLPEPKVTVVKTAVAAAATTN